MLIHVRKIFNCKLSLKCSCQGGSQLLRKNIEHSCDQVLRNDSLEIEFTITATKVLPIQLFSDNTASKQKM